MDNQVAEIAETLVIEYNQKISWDIDSNHRLVLYKISIISGDYQLQSFFKSIKDSKECIPYIEERFSLKGQVDIYFIIHPLSCLIIPENAVKICPVNTRSDLFYPSLTELERTSICSETI